MDNYPTMDLYASRMTKVICLVFVIISGSGFLYFQSASSSFIFSMGAAIACVSNVLKIYWLKASVTRATALNSAYSANYVRGQGMLRMLFTLAMLVGAGFLSQLEALGLPFLAGAIFGLLSMPVAGYSMAFFARKDYAINESNEGANTDV